MQVQRVILLQYSEDIPQTSVIPTLIFPTQCCPSIIMKCDKEIQGIRALTTEILAVLAAFASEFSRPTWKNIQVLLIA